MSESLALDENTIAEIESYINEDYVKELESLSHELEKLSKQNEILSSDHKRILEKLSEREVEIYGVNNRLIELRSQASEFERQVNSMNSLCEDWIKENEILKEILSIEFIYGDEQEKFPVNIQVDESQEKPVETKEEKVEESKEHEESASSVNNDEDSSSNEDSDTDQNDEYLEMFDPKDLDVEYELLSSKLTDKSYKKLLSFFVKLKAIYNEQSDELYIKEQERESLKESFKRYKAKVPSVIQHYRNCISKEKKGRKEAEMLASTYRKRISALESILKESSSESDTETSDSSDYSDDD